MKFYVFYSDNCKYCKLLLEKIHNENLIDFCHLISFETQPEKIPKFVKNVPTIIAHNLIKPLVGEDAINWIDNKKYFSQITNNIKKLNVVDPKIESSHGSLAWNKAESSRISDNYTHIDDTTINKKMLEFNNIESTTVIPNTNKKANQQTLNPNQPQTLTIENIPDLSDQLNLVDTDVKLNKVVQSKKVKELLQIRRAQLLNKKRCQTQI